MAGEIQLNSVSFATESSGLITVKNSKLDTDAVFPTFVGLILPFAYDTSGSPPSGFLECDGSAWSRTTYADLFSVLSTTWGVGDGSTTFNIPDLRGVFLRGSEQHASLTTSNQAVAGTQNSYSGTLKLYATNNTNQTGGNITQGGGVVRATSGYFSGSDTSIANIGLEILTNESYPTNVAVQYCIKY